MKLRFPIKLLSTISEIAFAVAIAILTAEKMRGYIFEYTYTRIHQKLLSILI